MKVLCFVTSLVLLLLLSILDFSRLLRASFWYPNENKRKWYAIVQFAMQRSSFALDLAIGRNTCRYWQIIRRVRNQIGIAPDAILFQGMFVTEQGSGRYARKDASNEDFRQSFGRMQISLVTYRIGV